MKNKTAFLLNLLLLCSVSIETQASINNTMTEQSAASKTVTAVQTPKDEKIQKPIEQWNTFEVALPVKNIQGNPFDIELTATFTNGKTSIQVNGFYDGDNTFKIRFMPELVGSWKYTTHSKLSAINGKKGSFECITAQGENHGMVKVSADGFNFMYADSSRYFPIGTTAYGYAHSIDKNIIDETVQSLKEAQFNKVRICVIPTNAPFSKEDPDALPFVCNSRTIDKNGKFQYDWDFSRFDPKFFQNLEECILRLKTEGIEADLILFHPYDKGRWGFDAMPMEVNLRYLKYIAARLSAFSNVWWSLANEFDLMKARQWEDWDVLSNQIVKSDPYRHLCSIHGSTASYYDYWKPQFTHTSIQDEAPVVECGRAAIVRNIYKKPIVFDEVCYEGNITNRWGRLSGQEMLYRMWCGIMAGTYVTHGECVGFSESDLRYISQGGKFLGESWKRIAFMRSILNELPGYLSFPDTSRDEITSSAGNGYYLVYFGRSMADSWSFSLPVKNAGHDKLKAGTKFKVQVIDTWNMTITDDPTTFEAVQIGNDRYRLYDKLNRKVLLPLSPYIMLRVVACDEINRAATGKEAKTKIQIDENE